MKKNQPFYKLLGNTYLLTYFMKFLLKIRFMKNFAINVQASNRFGRGGLIPLIFYDDVSMSQHSIMSPQM